MEHKYMKQINITESHTEHENGTVRHRRQCFESGHETMSIQKLCRRCKRCHELNLKTIGCVGEYTYAITNSLWPFGKEVNMRRERQITITFDGR